MTKEEKIAKLGEKIKGMRTCLFVTIDAQGNMKGRPMATQEADFDGSLWFMTDKRSSKCAEIKNDPRVGLNYAHGNGITFVSVSGTASFSGDPEKIKQFWNPFLKAWFEGPEDPNITLIEVKATRAEYWDNKAGKVGALADAAVGMVTGKQNTLDEDEVLDFASA